MLKLTVLWTRFIIRYFCEILNLTNVCMTSERVASGKNLLVNFERLLIGVYSWRTAISALFNL